MLSKFVIPHRGCVDFKLNSQLYAAKDTSRFSELVNQI